MMKKVWLIAAIALIPVPFLVFVSTKFSKKVLPKFKVNQQVLAELNSVVQDNISGIKEIQAFGKEKTECSGATYRLSYSAAHGIILDQGSNLCLLHWQVDSLPLSPRGSPHPSFFFFF